MGYFRLHETIIISFRLNMFFEDQYVDINKTAEGIMFLTLYVGDILLVGNKIEMIKTNSQ